MLCWVSQYYVGIRTQSSHSGQDPSSLLSLSPCTHTHHHHHCHHDTGQTRKEPSRMIQLCQRSQNNTLVAKKTAKNAEGKTETEAQSFNLTWEWWGRIFATTKTSSWLLLPASPELPLNTLYPKPNRHPRSQRKPLLVTLWTHGVLSFLFSYMC